MNMFAQYNRLSDGDDVWALMGRLQEYQADLLALNPAERSDSEVQEANAKQIMFLIGKIGMPTIQMLAAASLSRYQANGEPEWPYTPGQLGGKLQFPQWVELIPIVLGGIREFMAPTKDDIPAHAVEAAKRRPDPTKAEHQQNEAAAGGPPSIPSDAEPLDSLTLISEDPPSEGSV
jgi:hypothetical protein